MNQFEDEFQGDDPKEVRTVLEQVRSALDEFQRMAEFINEGRPLLETLEQQVSFLADHDGQVADGKTEQIARAVRERVDNERKIAHENQRPRATRVQLAPEFADDEDEFESGPKTVLRDGDEFLTSSLASLRRETNQDRRDEEEEDDYEDEDMDEWDDFDEFNEDEKEDIFDEMDDFDDED